MNPKHVLFTGEADSVFLCGDTCEFELQNQHAPLISLLVQADVIVDWSRRIPIQRGMVKFDKDECMILVEG